MNIEDINTLIIIENSITINDKKYEINLSLEDDIIAVQYIKGGKAFEEPEFIEVSLEKYRFFIDEWVKMDELYKESIAITDEKQSRLSAMQLLNATDFYYIRKQETGEQVPSVIVNARNDARNLLRDYGNSFSEKFKG